MKWPLIESQVRMQYRLLNHEGHYTRVRASHEKEEKYLFGIEEILDWARSRSGLGNLYISRNPFTKDRQVAGISGFSIDIDPVREPKDRAATTDEVRRTIIVARRILQDLVPGVLSTSGNGALLLFPFDSLVGTDMDKFESQAKEFESQIIERFSTKEVRIDATNYAKAVVRMLGSVNVKDADNRKWRYARFISRPVVHAKRSRVLDLIKGTVLLQPAPLDQLHSRTDNGIGGASVAGVALRSQENGLGPAARLDLAEKSLARLSPKRADEYDDWLKCGIALKEFGPVGFKLWKAWSDKHHTKDRERFSTDGMLEKWNSFGADQSLTVGTLKYWADLDSPRGLLLGDALRTVPGSTGGKLWTPGQPTGNTNVHGDRQDASISSGFKWLDSKLNGGYRPGVVYAISACTNVGKSAYVIQTAQHCCEAGRKVLLITTEASIEEVCQRYWAVGTGIPASQVSNGCTTEDRRGELARYQERFRTHQLGVWYTVSPKTEEIERVINDFKPDIVLWDYFQHFETGTESRQIQLGSLARWFESTALAYSVPFVVAAQLHERYDFKNRKRLAAIKDDIKDCKVLNDAAKTVIVLDWDQREQQTEDGPVLVRLALEKNKGPMGETKILLRRQIPRFEEV